MLKKPEQKCAPVRGGASSFIHYCKRSEVERSIHPALRWVDSSILSTTAASLRSALARAKYTKRLHATTTQKARLTRLGLGLGLG